ncbi:MAG TPA: ATP-binding protein [Pyrinomonadaceae bacterium]|nr:ATP-binding protein [Pyrinomonadaceae bacterium]
MKDGEDGGNVVYSRLRIDEGDEGRRAPEPKKDDAPLREPGRVSLARTLLPLLVGFTLLVGLVIGLGVLAARELETISRSTFNEQQRHAGAQSRLLQLRIALLNLNTEARIRARIDAGTAGATLPPMGIRLENAQGEVRAALAQFEQLPYARTDEGAALRAEVERFVRITDDLRAYSLEGFSAHREIDAKLERLYADAGSEGQRIGERKDEALDRAGRWISFLKWLAAVTGLVVAAATILEVLRRLRELRRSFETVRRERQFNRQMLEGMVSAIAAVDRAGRIRGANNAFRELFPRASDGAQIADLGASDEAAKMLDAATSSSVERSTYRGRWRLARESVANERTFDVYSSPLEIEGETGRLVTLVDVTEAARAETELRRSESLAAVGQATAQVAHEIKNPLGSIRLGVAMLRDMTRDRESINTIDLVERGIDHLNKLTSDVTQFSRRRRLALADTELHELIEDSLDLARDRIRDKRARVEKHLAGEPVRGRWDSDQLRQVFLNLFANALDASAEGQPLTISTERFERGADTSPAAGGNGARGAESPAPWARVTVADNGAGMDEATLERIFEPFFTTKKRGTGLGLAIARQIVEQHGGRIRAASTQGEGTRFTVELPLEARDNA